jgi:hypothetical protein
MGYKSDGITLVLEISNPRAMEGFLRNALALNLEKSDATSIDINNIVISTKK